MTEAKRPPLVADALLWYVSEARQQKQPPTPPKRRQPKVARLMSPRQRRVSSQTKDRIRAIYGTESKWNQTPEAPENVEMTRNVGPSDMDPNAPGWGSKATNSVTGAYRHERPEQRRRGSGGGQQRRTAADWSAIADQY